MDRISSAFKDPRMRVRASYFAVLALGVAFSVVVLFYTGQVLEGSRRLVGSELPLLERITSLKVELARQEAALHDYYAAGSRERFESTFGESSETTRRLLDEIERDYGTGEPVPRVRALLDRFYLQARALQPVFTLTPEATDDAPRVLARASDLVRELHAELDVLASLVEARAFESASLTRDSVRSMAQFAILFAMAVFLIAVFVGHTINLYLRASLERRQLAVFVERNPNPVMRLAAGGQVIYANAAAHDLARAMGGDPSVLLPEDLGERLDRLRASEARYETWEYQREARWFECGVHFLPDLGIFHAYVTDATERRRNAEQVVFQAYHHPLTGLPNRRMFQEVVEQALWTPEDGGAPAGVFVIGVDRFKIMSDTLGHATGDQLLQAIAARLGLALEDCREYYSGHAALYHIEGDTFAVFAPGLTGDQAAAQLAERLLQRSAQPLYVGGREYFLGFSIGIALFPTDGKKAAELLANASTAMQRVRAQGGRGFRLYKPEMNATAAQYLALENYLRHAIEHGELRLHYQPQRDAASGRVVALEALLRWEHPQRGVLTPRDFLALAEESGLILPIGDWVLRNACAQNRAWRERGVLQAVVAVNISARQFHRQDLPALIRGVLAETRLPPQALELEITESVAMEDVARTAEMLHELKDMGVRLAIDDFGTGFSSLAYLKRFPLDKLKIDQSFVRTVTSENTDAAIVRAIVTLGHALDLTVVGEGVETPEQLERLREYGCDEVQGLLLGQPLSAARLETYLRTPARTAAPA